MEIRECKDPRLEDILYLYRRIGRTNDLNRADAPERAYAASLCALGAYDAYRVVEGVCPCRFLKRNRLSSYPFYNRPPVCTVSCYGVRTEAYTNGTKSALLRLSRLCC